MKPAKYYFEVPKNFFWAPQEEIMRWNLISARSLSRLWKYKPLFP